MASIIGWLISVVLICCGTYNAIAASSRNCYYLYTGSYYYSDTQYLVCIAVCVLSLHAYYSHYPYCYTL